MCLANYTYPSKSDSKFQSNALTLYCSFILDIFHAFSHFWWNHYDFSRIGVGDNLSWNGMKYKSQNIAFSFHPLFYHKHKNLVKNQNGTLFYIILMLYYLYIKIILICTPYNIINYRQIWLFSAGFFRFQIKMNVFDQNHGEIGHFCIKIM